ncbi:DUF4193 domain-containing protein [Sinomonas sp. P10A9]|uniref:DUF4193 domain-containing protein n=1 Tax=Sinomonas puerhi TaxID=3238584 RepID=A0AB39L1M7_9MICC
MAVDYDQPRNREEEQEESLEVLKPAGRDAARAAVLELDDNDTAEGIDLPGADLSGLELTIQVVPVQENEFVCASCFLVRHRSQKALERHGETYCTDCEG